MHRAHPLLLLRSWSGASPRIFSHLMVLFTLVIRVSHSALLFVLSREPWSRVLCPRSRRKPVTRNTRPGATWQVRHSQGLVGRGVCGRSSRANWTDKR